MSATSYAAVTDPETYFRVPKPPVQSRQGVKGIRAKSTSNLLGIRPFACVSTLLNMAKLAVAAAYIIILMGSVHLHMHNFDDGGFMPYGFAGVLNAVAGSGVIYAYFGVHSRGCQELASADCGQWR